MRSDTITTLAVHLLAGCLALFAVGAAWSWLVDPSFARAAGAALMLASVPAVLASGPRAGEHRVRAGVAALGAGLFAVGALALTS